MRRERAEPIPNVTLQAVVGHNYEFNITTAGVQASIPLPVFNRNQGTVREAQSDLSRDHAELDRVALSLRQRLADAATRYEDALPVGRGLPLREPAARAAGLRGPVGRTSASGARPTPRCSWPSAPTST